MKKFIRIMALSLALTFSVGAFAACGGSDAETTAAKTEETTKAETTAANTDETTTSGDNTGKLVMGTNASFPPYEYIEGGKIVGIDAEIAAKIAEKLNLTLEIQDMKFDSIITSVSTGLIDMGMAGMTVTDERLENVNFSKSYATGIQAVIVKEGSDIKTVDDLKDKKIGVQLSTTGDIYATDEFGKDFVTQYNTGNEAVIALTQDKIDAVIIDNEPAKAYVAQNAGLTILETQYAVEDYAIAIAKDNTKLLDQINEALQELIDDGVVAEIVEKYIPSK